MKSLLCLFVKNEVNDLPEWLVHHALLGFDRIVVYDNKSDDGTYELARELSNTLPMEVVTWADDEKPVKHLSKQCAAYTECIARFRSETDWMLFLDGDEFLVPQSPDAKVSELLNRTDLGDAFAINWIIFGSGGVEDSKGRLVMEAFDRRSRVNFNPNRHVKMFFRCDVARRVRNPHFIETTTPCRDLVGRIVNWTESGILEPSGVLANSWRLHHYFVRSREHWRRRMLRRQPGGATRPWATFDNYDRNEVIDLRALPFARRVQERLAVMGYERRPAPDVAPEPEAAAFKEFEQPLATRNRLSPVVCVIDSISDGQIVGWAAVPDRPEYQVTLRIALDDEKYELFDCRLSRKDVLRSKLKAEFVGFRFSLPTDLEKGQQHRMSVQDMNNRRVRFWVDGVHKETHEFVVPATNSLAKAP